MKGSEIRERFLNYFEERGHVIRESASLIPASDPTLLFTSAGMVPFKRYFFGEGDLPFRKVATSQRCLRNSDIEQVGRTSRHHTYFEMLGNFSFGDYFKEEAILWAWEFLVKDMGIPKERLWISIYYDDTEAGRIWEKIIGSSQKKRIVKRGEKDNFWKMGETGPCGPCSEIIYDQGPEVGCRMPTCSIDCDCDRYLELWNLVFTQFDRKKGGELTPLPQKNIDTGMGLERLSSIMQGVKSNFDTDLLRPIVDYVCKLAKVNYEDYVISLRIIADHIRAICFLIYDGVLPSNEGRGYVLRFLLRRAIRQIRRLGVTDTFLYKIVAITSSIYHELREDREHISNIVRLEEERFIHTLDKGLIVLEDMITQYSKRKQRAIKGEDVFRLYDTYGFPMELTEEVARERGFLIDKEGFDKEMEKQKRRSPWKKPKALPYEEVGREIKGTKEFTGYERYEEDIQISTILKDRHPIIEAKEGDIIEVTLTDKTPFYAEAGGQVGDTGELIAKDVKVEVTDTQKEKNGVVIHKGKVVRGHIRVGDRIKAKVDKSRRLAIAKNHTATHLLQGALRKILGRHIRQTGSYVSDTYFRFDFTHLKPLTLQERHMVEELVNEKIQDNLNVETFYTTKEQAKGLGAIALFEEEYGEVVRVVKISDFSMELCGGTHCRATGEIGIFKLIQETGVSSGVRRIEGRTGKSCYEYISRKEEILNEIEDYLKTDKIMERIGYLVETNKRLERENLSLKNRLAKGRIPDFISRAIYVEGIPIISEKVLDVDSTTLRELSDLLIERLRSGIVILGGVVDRHVVFIAKISKDLTQRVHAGKLINEVAKIVGGGGGGRPDFGQAGGIDQEKLEYALKEGIKIIKKRLEG
ncbi:MAG: alanine--tRNA ligase [bacterium]|nr:alanine--tRNA ligase [bacterium]